MNTLELSKELHKNMNKILSPTGYKHIINRGNNLIRFDVVNRMLIEMQLQNAYELKTEEEWLIENRKIRNKQKPIYLVMPKYTYEYIECDTGEKLINNDLSVDELKKAIEYNIVEKVEVIDDMYVLPFYDIKQTNSLNNIEYSVNKPIVNTDELLNIAHNITGANIEQCDESYYSTSQNTIFISKQPYNNLVLTLSEYITHYFMNNELENVMKLTTDYSEDDLTEYDKELIKESIQYAISSLFRVNGEYTFDYISHTSNDKIITILNIVDNLMLEVISRFKFTETEGIKDAVASVSRLRRAEALLDIMEANDINKKMKGAY